MGKNYGQSREKPEKIENNGEKLHKRGKLLKKITKTDKKWKKLS